MYLYSLTLQKASAITLACYGNFSDPKAQEIVAVRGKVLDLLRPDENGKVQTINSIEVFGLIRSISPFRLTGGNRDYLVIGSDSGRIIILMYSMERNEWEKIHQETYGKTGCRRIVPGEYVAADPRGRAVMVGAAEKQKLVYILNRDSAARLTISSPLEAHKTHTLCFGITGVDVGFENPIFAAIEVDYEEVDTDPETGEVVYEKNLTFYELDLGLNHVVRKWSDAVDPTANLLVPVPGGNDGPGGILVLAENFIVYKNQGHDEKRCALPRRYDFPIDKGLLIVSFAVHKQKDLFFIVLQSELGDLYKVSITYEEDVVQEIRARYLDTIPIAKSLCILKTGFLFAASEFGNHGLYQFQGIGDDEDAPMHSSLEIDAGETTVKFLIPHTLQNLLLVDELQNLSPIVDAKLMKLQKEETPQLYTLCGRGAQSSLRILRHGIAVSEMAVSELPGNPNAVWTVKDNAADEYDKYIVVSFINATLVLSIGETVEEVTDSGFLSTSQTLCISRLGENALLQVHPGGIRHIRADKRINEWKTPGKRTIVKASVNERQVVVALTGGELIYFELDMSDNLLEVDKKDMGHDVSCLDIPAIPAGRQRARFLAVGGWDNTLRILSLEPDDCMTVLAVQALPAQAESVCIVNMQSKGTGANSSTLFLNIGLHNGVLLRIHLDEVNGQLSDTRTRFLGARAVKLFKLNIHGQPGFLALSSRPWAAYTYQSNFSLAPLSYESLEFASSFTSEQCPEGIVAISGNTLRIITTEKLEQQFNSETMPLQYTPRHMCVHPTSKYLMIIETDNNCHSEVDKQALREQVAEEAGIELEVPQPAAVEVEDSDVLSERQIGVPHAGEGTWGSCIRLVDVGTKSTLSILELSDNEAAFSICTCQFRDRGGEWFVVVGTVKDLQLHPRKCSGGFLHVYKGINNNTQLELVHKTPVDDVPYALCPYQGRLLVGVGHVLRIYDMGKKKLLRKCENKTFPNLIMHLSLVGERIIVGDIAESIFFVKYKRMENQLYIFADDVNPRWLTSICTLDYNTQAGADKFGNIFVCRLAQEISEDVEEDPTGSRIKWDSGALNGAANKADEIVQYHVGETVNTLQKCSLSEGGSEVILYTTIMGGIGALLPFTSRDDVEFFTHLEMHLRQENAPLCGREHLFFRSFYFPCKDVVDGDLCEQFNLLSPDLQRQIAGELDRTPGEVLKKLEDIRNRIL